MQQGGWFFYVLIPSFVIFVIAMVGETNVSLLWILAVFAIRALRGSGGNAATVLVAVGTVVLVVVVVAFLLLGRRPPSPEIDVVSDYPVPPLDLAVPARPPREAAGHTGLRAP